MGLQMYMYQQHLHCSCTIYIVPYYDKLIAYCLLLVLLCRKQIQTFIFRLVIHSRPNCGDVNELNILQVRLEPMLSQFPQQIVGCSRTTMDENFHTWWKYTNINLSKWTTKNKYSLQHVPKPGLLTDWPFSARDLTEHREKDCFWTYIYT